MKVYALTIAFCPAAQFARTIIEWRNTGNCMDVDKHIVVQGHYPINTAKNNRDIKLLSDSFGGLEFIDLGNDMGCAQIQTLMMRSFPEYDAFINVDPDSACETNWLGDAMELFEREENCIVASCFSPLVERFMAKRGYLFPHNLNQLVGIPQSPTPFNLSLWRNSFFREIGGVPQGGSKWGETEGGVWYHASRLGKYHAYLLDHVEDESGKLMQDRQLLEYKDAHLRMPEDRFPGFFIEYLRWKHPELLYLDTEIPENTQFQ